MLYFALSSSPGAGSFFAHAVFSVGGGNLTVGKGVGTVDAVGHPGGYLGTTHSTGHLFPIVPLGLITGRI